MTSWKDTLVTGKQDLAPRICVYGQHGIGKSTLAASMPKPIFISTEDGLASLDVTSFPRAQHVDEVATAIRTLIKEEHDFKTCVIDTVDWLVDPLISKDVESRYDAKDLSYGKYAVYVAEALRELFTGLDVLRRKRHMNIVLIAHAGIQRFEDPRTEAYDRFQPKLPTRANDILKEWCDVIAFATFKVIIRKQESGFNSERYRGITNGDRILHLVETPAYVAKNRYDCPDEIAMTYEALKSAIPVIAE